MVIRREGSINPGTVNLNIMNWESFPNKSIFPHRSAYMTFEIELDDPKFKNK